MTAYLKKQNQNNIQNFANNQYDQPKKRYAALDLGTNNCRLLIAEAKDSGFRIVDSFSRIVRLGEGISYKNRLNDAACERAIAALKICQRKIKNHNVHNARLIATEACRITENGPTFVQKIYAETGLKLEVINRKTEAYLAITGCVSLIDPKSDGIILFDIGGGSSEIVWINRKGQRRYKSLGGVLQAWDSLPFGVVTLSEYYDGKNITRPKFELMVREVQKRLQKFPQRPLLHQAIKKGNYHFIGTSGTVTTLAGLHLKLNRYNRSQVDGLWMECNSASMMIDQLIDLGYAGRVAHPCIDRKRADLVLPGCAIFEAIRREFNCQYLRVADRGLREGMLIELIRKDRMQAKQKDREYNSQNIYKAKTQYNLAEL